MQKLASFFCCYPLLFVGLCEQDYVRHLEQWGEGAGGAELSTFFYILETLYILQVIYVI